MSPLDVAGAGDLFLGFALPASGVCFVASRRVAGCCSVWQSVAVSNMATHTAMSHGRQCVACLGTTNCSGNKMLDTFNTERYSVLTWKAVCCSALEYVAVCCNEFQCGTLFCAVCCGG